MMIELDTEVYLIYMVAFPLFCFILGLILGLKAKKREQKG